MTAADAHRTAAAELRAHAHKLRVEAGRHYHGAFMARSTVVTDSDIADAHIFAGLVAAARRLEGTAAAHQQHAAAEEGQE